MVMEIDSAPKAGGKIRFTVATLVNDEAHYAAMRASFERHGLGGADVEWLATRGATDAYAALNAMLARAHGDLVVLCHQDVRLIGDGRAELETRLRDLERAHPDWALAGNAGGEAAGRLAIRITDPHAANSRVGTLPARVMSLDENFIVVRRASGLRFSRDLHGFHLYGADICLVADVLGWSAWVIDFHLAHLSPGRKDRSFAEAEARFRRKWSLALRPRWMQTPCTLLRLSPGGLARLAPFLEGLARRVSRRLPGAAGWRRASA
jgi:hypothetical protein